MKDYLVSFSVLGLILGLYSVVVLTQSKPAHAISHEAHLSSMNPEKVSENQVETAPPSNTETSQKLTR